MESLTFWESYLAALRASKQRKPDYTLDDLILDTEELVADLRSEREQQAAPCKNCGRPTVPHAGARWHLGPKGKIANRGCRATSFEWREGAEGGWDESLPKDMYAAVDRRE